MGGGFAAMNNGSFGSLENLGLSLLVMLTIVLLQRSKNPWLRLSAIVIAMLLGYLAAYFLGRLNPLQASETLLALPQPLHYGLGFNWQFFVPITVIFVVTALEAIGDMTATSDVSGEPVDGPLYMTRIKGGVLSDGLTMPRPWSAPSMSVFAQNNGVIQLTGSPAAMSVSLSPPCWPCWLLPGVAAFIQEFPELVLGGRHRGDVRHHSRRRSTHHLPRGFRIAAL